MLSLVFVTLFIVSSWLGPVCALSLSGHNLEHRAHHAVVMRHATPVKRARKISKRCAKLLNSSSTITHSSTHSSTKVGPTSSKKAAAPKATTRPAASYSSGKQGLAWGADGDLVKNFVVKGAPVYNWGPNPPMDALKYGMKPIPMLWGHKNLDSSCGDQDRCFGKIKKGGVFDTVMGMNEPNQDGQSDISWQEGVQMWKQHIEPLATGDNAMRTVSPATTSNPNGLVWMKNFVNGCSGCHIDVIALHWYDVDADEFIRYITNFHNVFNKPIWVTEFACQNMNGGEQCSQSKANAFMRKVTSFMDSVSWVEHYFAFGIHHLNGVNAVNQLMDDSGNPTYQGNLFLGRAN